MKIIAKCTKNKLILYLSLVVCAFSSAIIFSPRSYAIASEEVSFVSSGNFNYFDTEWNGPMTCSNGICQNNTESNITGLNTLGFVPPNGTYYTDNIFRFDVFLWRVGANVSDHTVFNKLSVVNDTLYSLYDVEFEQLDANASVVHIYIKVKQQHSIYDGSRIAVNSGVNNVFIMAFHPTERMSAGSWSLWAIKNTSVDTQSIVNAINSQPQAKDYTQNLNSINSGIGSVNNNLNQVNNNLNDLKDSQDQANQDANDRYEDEKDTINDNGDSANSSWTDNTDNLKFDAPTGLFSWLWSVGTTEQCVNIPVINSLLHANTPQYCSWWSTSFRSIASPIINIFIVMFLSGFVIRWLSRSGI